MAETRTERLARAANRARRNLDLRSEGITRMLVRQRAELEASLREPAYGLGRQLLAAVDDTAPALAEADAADKEWRTSLGEVTP